MCCPGANIIVYLIACHFLYLPHNNKFKNFNRFVNRLTMHTKTKTKSIRTKIHINMNKFKCWRNGYLLQTLLRNGPFANL